MNAFVPEVLAPAGDRASVKAAIDGGADAVYFGLRDFNARARAENFAAADLPGVMQELHASGVRGYVTLNTLLFDDELTRFAELVRACDEAGVDAIIVQDVGAIALARAVAPRLAVHASTQATVTDAASCAFAQSLGAERAILARELSVEDVAAIAAVAPIPTEVFVHGALCVAYSGQCLTSEAIGGRSANRGACAQACRLPYELVVDGDVVDTEDRAFLLSPQDLDASDLVPALTAAGVASLKIEGRLKSPDYVFATSRLYRERVDKNVQESTRQRALTTFTRGSGPGFLGGTNHQALVDGKSPDHRGMALGTYHGLVTMRGSEAWIEMTLTAPLRRGDGLLVEGGFGSKGEVGGRVWQIRRTDEGDVEEGAAGETVLAWLGPDVRLASFNNLPDDGARVWKTNDPQVAREIAALRHQSAHRVALDATLRGALGEVPVLEATTARGARASVTGSRALERARTPVSADALRSKLDRFGDTPFVLRAFDMACAADAFFAPSELNEMRRALVAALSASDARPEKPAVPHAIAVSCDDARAALSALPAAPAHARGHDHASDARPRLVALARTKEQALAALRGGADELILDFLELTGTGAALREITAGDSKVRVGVAAPRIRKPGEEKIDRYLDSLAPHVRLVRSLGAVHEGRATTTGSSDALRVGDFSLNVTNRVTAALFLGRGLDYFTPSYDLNTQQLDALLDAELAPFAEVVVHTPMPLFHMEHCVYAHMLSEGADHRTCGRPCDRHALSLRDRAGFEHPVVADVGCRNTVFHARAQSAAEHVAGFVTRGVRRFRVELVREDAAAAEKVVRAYRDLLDDRTTARDVWNSLRADAGYGVVRGSLRVINA